MDKTIPSLGCVPRVPQGFSWSNRRTHTCYTGFMCLLVDSWAPLLVILSRNKQGIWPSNPAALAGASSQTRTMSKRSFCGAMCFEWSYGVRRLGHCLFNYQHSPTRRTASPKGSSSSAQLSAELAHGQPFPRSPTATAACAPVRSEGA